MNRRTFVTTLLATAFAPAMPRMPPPRLARGGFVPTRYYYVGEVPMELFGTRLPQVEAIWLDERRIDVRRAAA